MGERSYDPTLWPLEDRIAEIEASVRDAREQNIVTRRMIPTELQLREAVSAVRQAEADRLEKLRDDVIALIEVHIQRGTYTREEINAAITAKGRGSGDV